MTGQSMCAGPALRFRMAHMGKESDDDVAQVWQKPGWPHGRTDGIFVQMQSQGGPHRLYFVPLGQKSR